MKKKTDLQRNRKVLMIQKRKTSQFSLTKFDLEPGFKAG
jgi:hypothetical protein